MHKKTKEITKLILESAKRARSETGNEPDSTVVTSVEWPVHCTVGPGLEGAIACATKVGYVNGSKGALCYRGYDIFDLCAYSTFEEVCYLLLNGNLPTERQLKDFKQVLIGYRSIPDTLRHLMTFPVEEMSTMGALRLGTNLMRYKLTELEPGTDKSEEGRFIGSDEDSIAMETVPKGEEHAIYEFNGEDISSRIVEASYRLIAGLPAMAACISRLRNKRLPLAPDPKLSHAANFLYMMSGRLPTPEEERVMDVCLILHADHGMNASTFAALVVASTLSDIYSSVGAGIGALTGPLHGGANEQVLRMLKQIGSPKDVKSWFEKARSKKSRVMGMGHRVYKVYDPRARILSPLAQHLCKRNTDSWRLYKTAVGLEKEVIANLGKKGIFPNVDFYSGLVYSALGIPDAMFTPIFAVSRVSGWTSRIMEYMRHNRIFRPRAMYSGAVGRVYSPLRTRGEDAK